MNVPLVIDRLYGYLQGGQSEDLPSGKHAYRLA